MQTLTMKKNWKTVRTLNLTTYIKCPLAEVLFSLNSLILSSISMNESFSTWKIKYWLCFYFRCKEHLFPLPKIELYNIMVFFKRSTHCVPLWFACNKKLAKYQVSLLTWFVKSELVLFTYYRKYIFMSKMKTKGMEIQ